LGAANNTPFHVAHDHTSILTFLVSTVVAIVIAEADGTFADLALAAHWSSSALRKQHRQHEYGSA
jgi:hypothetical protein